MKKIMLTMIAAMVMSSAVFAQNNKEEKRHHGNRPNKTEMIKHRTDRIVEKYNLDEKQAAQLLELNTKFADKLGGPHGRHHGLRGHHDMKPDMEPDAQTGATAQQHEKMREERENNRKAYNAELQKIMTADQFKAYQADMSKRKGHGPRGFHQDKKDKE